MNREHFTIGEMLDMQKALQEKYKGQWEPICPGVGKNKLLWMIRKDLVEEMADVLMYFNDVLLCYGISEEELKKSYTDKFERNMKRW